MDTPGDDGEEELGGCFTEGSPSGNVRKLAISEAPVSLARRRRGAPPSAKPRI
jgi:hypothetical protein